MNQTAEQMLAAAPRPRPARLNHGFSGETADLGACAAAIRHGSKSFHLASLLLPRRIRSAAYALYAFCRHSDDLIDDPQAGQEALARLHHRLDLIYAGSPGPQACDRAFARVVHAHAIPKAIPLALLDGFAMDLAGRHPDNLAELKAYATRVASSVGIMMALVMGRGDAEALARAADLGIAMQLTNIARDVGEDARNGRLYLPRDWLLQAGLEPEAFLRNPQPSPALAGVIQRLLEEAEHHYRLGMAGIALLPADCRMAILTAALVYREIGWRLAAGGFDSVTRRTTVPLVSKLALLSQARGAMGLTAPAMQHQPPDPSAAALVEAAAQAFALSGQDRGPPAHGAEARPGIGRVASILMRLEADARQEARTRRLAARQRAGLHA